MAYFISLLFQTWDLSSKSKPNGSSKWTSLKAGPRSQLKKREPECLGSEFFPALFPSFVARGGKPHCWALAPLWSSARSSTPVAFKVSVTANLISDIVCGLVAQSCPALCDPMGRCPPGSSNHVIFQARILECVAISFSRVIFLTQGSKPGLLHCRQTLPSELPGKPY